LIHEEIGKNYEKPITSDTANKCYTSKIISAKIQSRHINRIQYDIYIKYNARNTISDEEFKEHISNEIKIGKGNRTSQESENSSNIPFKSDWESILGYICSCKSGLRTVGACSHSTAIMLFLSYGKYLDKLPQPGFRLNSFLVDGNIENEDNENNTDIELNLKEITKSQLTTKTTEKIPQKRKLSFKDINTPCKKNEKITQNSQIIKKNNKDIFENSVTFRSFSLKIPKWGGSIEVNESDFGELFITNNIYNDLPILNTCTIDYFLLATWASHLLSSKVRDIFNDRKNENLIEYLSKIVDLIENPLPLWDRAKTIWILIINKLNHNKSLEFDCWDSTYHKFYKHFEQHQAIQFKCENCLNFVRRDQVTLNLVKDENNNCYVDVHEFKECLECNLFINGKFVSKPFCLFVQVCEKSNNKINIGDIPLEIIIDGTEFQFLCATIFVNKNHFKAIFRLNGQNYLIDDLKAGFNKNIPKNMILDTVFYYLR
jgi:hypothetical protein